MTELHVHVDSLDTGYVVSVGGVHRAFTVHAEDELTDQVIYTSTGGWGGDHHFGWWPDRLGRNRLLVTAEDAGGQKPWIAIEKGL